MTPWHERVYEERSLFNPAFCSILLWHAGKGAVGNPNSLRSSLSYIEAFLILPLVLHQGTRESLPSRIDSSLPVWIKKNPLVIASLPDRARALVPHTKEALVFGGIGALYQFESNHLLVNNERESGIRAMLRQTSNEVQQCAKKARFLGRWFTYTGTPETIFTLLGIRP